jgi:polysaccharide biosynthesis/export protein
VPGARKIVLTLAISLSAPQVSRVAVAQEGSRAQYVGRVPGTEVAQVAASTAAQSQAQQTGDSVTLRGTAQEPGRADGTGDPVLGRDRHPLYRLHSGDTLEINFTFSPDWNQAFSVGPDGFLHLRGTTSIHAQGLSVPELQTAITNAYAGILHEPQISVVLKDFEKPYFLALGQVSHPGKYELRTDLTVTEAMAIAGGFTQQAKHSEVVLFRHASDQMIEARVLNVRQMLKRRDLNEDVHLQPGDLLYVPQSRISKIQRFMPSTVLGTYVNPMQF